MATITRQEVKAVQYHVCDFCTRVGVRVRPCFGCRRDVCNSCATVLENEPFTGDYTGDYPPYICKPCGEALPPYQERAHFVRERYEAELEAIEREYRTACAPPPAAGVAADVTGKE